MYLPRKNLPPWITLPYSTSFTCIHLKGRSLMKSFFLYFTYETWYKYVQEHINWVSLNN